MATIRREFMVSVTPAQVWDAVRDVGAAHKRLFPGVLVDARMDGDARIVTFANGLVLFLGEYLRRRAAPIGVGASSVPGGASAFSAAARPARWFPSTRIDCIIPKSPCTASSTIRRSISVPPSTFSPKDASRPTS